MPRNGIYSPLGPRRRYVFMFEKLEEREGEVCL